jgi:hypothetical protein
MTKLFNRGLVKVGALVVATVVVQGCVLKQKEDDVSKFQEALPQADNVKVAGPEDSQAAGSGSTQSIQSDEPWAQGPWAKWYGFTRHVRKGVNTITGTILGSVWIIVHTQPTDISEGQATWGPYTDALEPVAWRFRITKVGDQEYDYFLEGRPKGSSAESDYQAVLNGKGWAKGNPNHGDGFFEINLDTLKSLDPFEHQDDSGSIKITHDLPPDITTHLDAQPRSITAEVHPNATEAWFKATSNSKEDGTGTLFVTAHADADDSNMTALEDISFKSEWNAQGAGRADVGITGGDVPTSIDHVDAVECWGTDFYRVYYHDSVDYETTEGDPNECAFQTPAQAD